MDGRGNRWTKTAFPDSVKEGVSLSRGCWGRGGETSGPLPFFCGGHSPLPTVNSLLLKNITMESSSKRRLVCLKKGTRHVAGWIRTFHSFNRTSFPPLPHPYERLTYVVFVFGTFEDCILQIRGVHNVVYRKKDRDCLSLLKMECPMLFSAPHFLFRSSAAEISWISIKDTGTTLKSISGYKSPLSGDHVLFSICTDSFPLGARDLFLAVYSYDLFFKLISSLYSPLCPEERQPLYRLLRGHFLLREAQQIRCFSNFESVL